MMAVERWSPDEGNIRVGSHSRTLAQSPEYHVGVLLLVRLIRRCESSLLIGTVTFGERIVFLVVIFVVIFVIVLAIIILLIIGIFVVIIIVVVVKDGLFLIFLLLSLLFGFLSEAADAIFLGEGIIDGEPALGARAVGADPVVLPRVSARKFMEMGTLVDQIIRVGSQKLGSSASV